MSFISLCLYTTKLAPIFKTGHAKRSPRAPRPCAKHRASAKQKCGERNTQCGLGFAKLFSGEKDSQNLG